VIYGLRTRQSGGKAPNANGVVVEAAGDELVAARQGADGPWRGDAVLKRRLRGMNRDKIELWSCRRRRGPAPAPDRSVVPVAGEIGQSIALGRTEVQ
jgi:hypothetical protein